MYFKEAVFLISEKQRELDKIKWEKSVLLGTDACGTFDYCKMCEKSKDNPCECAFNKFYNVDLGEHELVIGATEDKFEVIEKPKKKTSSVTKKSTSKNAETCKKSPAKKASAKSSTKGSTKKSTK